MKVINDLLNYNDLKIIQDTDYFMFSLDSVLLANFVRVNKKMKIIDFCTGNAPIPLFLSCKNTKKIIGVEIQKEIYNLAKESIYINNLQEKIQIINMDVKSLPEIFETDTFDLITCNPPYFKLTQSSNINKNENKAIARHEISLNLNDIFKVAKKLLKNNGRIAIVHRADRLIDIIESMKKNNIEPKRLKFIYPKLGKKSNMILIEGSKNGNPGIIVEEPLIAHEENGQYTEEIKSIFNGG